LAVFSSRITPQTGSFGMVSILTSLSRLALLAIMVSGYKDKEKKERVFFTQVNTLACQLSIFLAVFVSRNILGSTLVCYRLARTELRIPCHSQRKLPCAFLSTFTTQLLLLLLSAKNRVLCTRLLTRHFVLNLSLGWNGFWIRSLGRREGTVVGLGLVWGVCGGHVISSIVVLVRALMLLNSVSSP